MNKKLFDAIKYGDIKDEKKLSHAIQLLNETAELANSIAKMEDNRSRYESLSQEMQDNGDPGYLLEEGIMKSGLALAAAVTYFSEYFKEAFGISLENTEE